MDYEQKYKDALERAKRMFSEKELNYLFPELKESEDERIRKEIIEYIKTGTYHKNWVVWLEKQEEKTNPYSGVSFEYNGHIWGMCARDNGVDILLDKQLFKHLDTQGGQKPADSVAPKLKIESGKWYLCIRTLLDAYGGIAFLEGDVYLSKKDGYLIPSSSNVPMNMIYCVDRYFKNWDIDDAKDGDVLVDVYGNIGIYCKRFEIDWLSYCSLGNNGGFQPFEIEREIENTHPATKEQQKLLFREMKEAGWKWDVEKKELKKIGNEIEIPFGAKDSELQEAT